MLLISTSSLKGYGIHKMFLLTKKMGFEGIDLHVDEKYYDTFDGEYLLSLSETLGVPIRCISAPEKGITSKEKVERIIDLAQKVGSQIVVFSPSYIRDKNSDWYYEYLQNLKKRTYLRIALQNVEQKFYIFIIPEYKNNNVVDLKKITGDTALNVGNIDKNSWMDLIKMYFILEKSIVNVYLSDKFWIREGMIPGNAPGGISYLPLESLFMKLKSAGYQGYFSLKVRPSELWVGDEEKVLYNAAKFQEYFHKHFTNYVPEY